MQTKMMNISEIINLNQDDYKEMSIQELKRILEIQQIEIEKLTSQIAEQKLIKQELEEMLKSNI